MKQNCETFVARVPYIFHRSLCRRFTYTKEHQVEKEARCDMWDVWGVVMSRNPPYVQNAS